MGCTTSKQIGECTVPEQSQNRVEPSIEKELIKEVAPILHQSPSSTFEAAVIDLEEAVDITDIMETSAKLLIVGSRGAGKATLMKQLRMIGRVVYTREEVNLYRQVIRANTLEYAHNNLLPLMKDNIKQDRVKIAYERVEKALNAIDFTGDKKDDAFANTNAIGQTTQSLLATTEKVGVFMSIWKEINILWRSRERQEIWKEHSHLVKHPSHKRYLDDILRLADPHFCPSDTDILLARVDQSGMLSSNQDTMIENGSFEAHCIASDRGDLSAFMVGMDDDIDIIVCVASLSDYDEKLPDGTNKTVDSMQLFRKVCNEPSFHHLPIALVLTHADVFEDKLQKSKLQDQSPFQNFKGATRDEAISYLEEEFRACARDENDPLVFVLNATSKQEVREAMSEIAAMGTVMSNFMENF